MQKPHIETLLLDREKNRENYSLLIESFNKNDFVAFTGAGILCTIRGTHNTKELYLELKKKYKLKSRREGTPEDFFHLYKKCEQKESFYQDIFALVTSFLNITNAPGASKMISRAFNCFVTTNYYDPIEAESGITRYFFIFPELSKQRNSITYLHGHLEIGFGVVKKDDYEFFYPSLYNKNKGVFVLENSLQCLFTEKRVVFLGCRLEDDVKKYLKHLVNKIDKNAVVKEHFWITDESMIGANKSDKEGSSEKEAEMRKLEETFFESNLDIKVRPIVYNEGCHCFVEELCKVLSEKKPIVLDEQPDPSRV